MSVASWIRSQFTTQDPATYKAAIDGNFAVVERVSAMFAPQQVATPNMTMQVRAGAVMDSGTLTEVALQTTGTIAAPVATSRIDRVVLDQRTYAITVVTGTPSGTPVPPAIPAGQLPCAQILLQSTSTAITNSMITDERVFGSVSDAYVDALFAPLASATLTGIPRAPTAAPLNNSTQLATTAYVDAAATAATFASGTRMPFNQTAAPTGWTKDTTAALNDTAMRIVTGAVGSGGANAFSTAAYTPTMTPSLMADSHSLTIAEMPSHGHTVSMYSLGTLAPRPTTTAAGATTPVASGQVADANGGGGGHTHTVSGTVASSIITLGIKYNDFIIASKN